jgi:hypothetical protein
MNGKGLFAIVICGVIIAVAFLGVSQLRYNQGISVGAKQGYGLGEQAATRAGAYAAYQNGLTDGNKTGYEQGFQAGLKQAGGIPNNSTG